MSLLIQNLNKSSKFKLNGSVYFIRHLNNDQQSKKYYDLNIPLKPKNDINEPINKKHILNLSFGNNQFVEVNDKKSRMLNNILNSFKAPIRYGFAYGSGVFQQKGYNEHDKPLVDFIIAVTHPYHWHSINIQQNPSHYPLPAKLFGSKAIYFLQHTFGARIWYVSMVDIDGIVS